MSWLWTGFKMKVGAELADLAIGMLWLAVIIFIAGIYAAWKLRRRPGDCPSCGTPTRYELVIGGSLDRCPNCHWLGHAR